MKNNLLRTCIILLFFCVFDIEGVKTEARGKQPLRILQQNAWEDDYQLQDDKPSKQRRDLRTAQKRIEKFRQKEAEGKISLNEDDERYAASTMYGKQMVLNAVGQLIPVGSDKNAPYGYVKNSAGQMKPATSLAEGLIAGEEASSPSSLSSAKKSSRSTKTVSTVAKVVQKASESLLSKDQLDQLLAEKMEILKKIAKEDKNGNKLLQDAASAVKDNTKVSKAWDNSVDDLFIISDSKKRREDIKQKHTKIKETDSERKQVWQEAYDKFLEAIESDIQCRKLYHDLCEKNEDIASKFQLELTLLKKRSESSWEKVHEKAEQLKQLENEQELALNTAKEETEKLLLTSDTTNISVSDRNRLKKLWNKAASKASEVIRKDIEYRNSIITARNNEQKVKAKEVMLQMEYDLWIKSMSTKVQATAINIRQIHTLLNNELQRCLIMSILRKKFSSNSGSGDRSSK